MSEWQNTQLSYNTIAVPNTSELTNIWTHACILVCVFYQKYLLLQISNEVQEKLLSFSPKMFPPLSIYQIDFFFKYINYHRISEKEIACFGLNEKYKMDL